MRINSLNLIVCGVLGLGAAFGATRAETTTYVDGNLTGVSPNTGGTLLFSDDKAMYFRTGLATVAVPYEGITKAELGAVKENSHDVPLYKVWALHKRFSGKTHTQFLVVDFKNEEGEPKTMTLEVAQTSANEVLSTIQGHSGDGATASSETSTAAPSAPALVDRAARTTAAQPKPASAKASGDDWWGDGYWKTHRNADKWNKSSGPIAPQD